MFEIFDDRGEATPILWLLLSLLGLVWYQSHKILALVVKTFPVLVTIASFFSELAVLAGTTLLLARELVVLLWSVLFGEDAPEPTTSATRTTTTTTCEKKHEPTWMYDDCWHKTPFLKPLPPKPRVARPPPPPTSLWDPAAGCFRKILAAPPPPPSPPKVDYETALADLRAMLAGPCAAKAAAAHFAGRPGWSNLPAPAPVFVPAPVFAPAPAFSAPAPPTFFPPPPPTFFPPPPQQQQQQPVVFPVAPAPVAAPPAPVRALVAPRQAPPPPPSSGAPKRNVVSGPPPSLLGFAPAVPKKPRWDSPEPATAPAGPPPAKNAIFDAEDVFAAELMGEMEKQGMK